MRILLLFALAVVAAGSTGARSRRKSFPKSGSILTRDIESFVSQTNREARVSTFIKILTRFGQLAATQPYQPRYIQFGLRIFF